MVGPTYGFKIKYDVDTTGLKNLEALKKMLQQISNMRGISDKNLDVDKIKAAGKAADILSDALHKSENVDLGKINVSTFMNSIKSAGYSVQSLSDDLDGAAGGVGKQAFQRLQAEVNTTEKVIKKTSGALTDMYDTLVKTAKWSISSSIINTMSGNIQKAVGYVKDLDESLTNIRIVTGASADEMEDFAVSSNAAAKALGSSTLAYTDAALIYFQQGKKSNEANQLAELTVKAANVSQATAEDMSNYLTAVWNGYKVSSDQAGLAVDKLAAVAAATGADLEELSIGMSKVASAANMMGVDMDQMNAILSTITTVTREAPESVGTSVKTIFSRMTDLSEGKTDEDGFDFGDVEDNLQKLGMTMVDGQGKLRDMGNVIEDIGGKWKGLSKESQIALAQTMAGTRQYSRLISLFDNWEMYEGALQVSKDAAGTLDEQTEVYLESFKAKSKALQASLENLWSEIIDVEVLKDGADLLSGTVTVVDSLIESLGGVNNFLVIIGATLAKTFSKNIANTISGAAKSFKELLNNKNQTRNVNELLGVSPKKESVGDGQEESLSKYQEYANEVNKVWQAMDIKSQEKAQSLAKQIVATEELIAAEKKSLATTEEQIAIYKELDGTVVKTKDDNIELWNQMTAVITSATEEGELFKQKLLETSDTPLTVDDALVALEATFEDLGHKAESFQRVLNKPSSGSVVDIQEDLTRIARWFPELEAEIRKVEQGTNVWGDTTKLVDTQLNIVLAAMKEVSNQIVVAKTVSGTLTLDELQGSATSSKVVIEELIRELNNAAEAGKKLNKSFEGTAKIQKAVDIMSAGSMAGAALGGTIETVADKSSSVSQIMTSVTTSVGSAASGLVMLNSAAKAAGVGLTKFLGVPGMIITAVSFLVPIISSGLDITGKKAKEAAQKVADAKQEIEDLTTTLKNNQKTVSELKEDYATLSQGVNQFTNANEALSTEQYEEYVKITNQLAELYPELKLGTDSQGNAILNLNGNYETIINTLDEVLKKQREVAREQIVIDSKTAIAGDKKEYAKLTNKIEEAKSKGIKSSSGTVIDSAEDFTYALANDYNVSLTIPVKDRDNYKKTVEELKALEEDFPQLELSETGNIAGTTKYLEFLYFDSLDAEKQEEVKERVANIYTTFTEENKKGQAAIDKEVDGYVEQQKDIVSKNVNRMIGYAESTEVYNSTKISESMKAILGTALEQVDLEDYGDDPTKIVDEILKTMSESTGEVKNAYDELISIGPLNTKEDIEKANAYVNTITNSLKGTLDKKDFGKLLRERFGITTAEHILPENLSALMVKKLGKDLAPTKDLIEKNFKGVKAEVAYQILADSKKGDFASFADFETAVNDLVSEINGIEITSNFDFTDQVEEMTNFQESLSGVTEALGEQTTGVGISVEAIQTLITIDRDYSDALEYRNGVMQINLDIANDITESNIKEEKSRIKLNRAMAQAKYLKLAKEIETLTVQQRQELANIEDQITGYDLMIGKLDETASAYGKWKNAQNAPEQGDMFDDALDALTQLKEGVENNEWATPKVEAAVQFFLDDDSLELTKEVAEETSKKISKWLTPDDKQIGILNFLNKLTDEKILEKTADGFKIIGEQSLEGISEQLGVSVGLIQAMFGQLKEGGAKFDFSKSIDSSSDALYEATKKVVDLQDKVNKGGTEYAEALETAKVEQDKLFSEATTKNVSDYADKVQALADAKAAIEGKTTFQISAGGLQEAVDTAQTELDQLEIKPTIVDIEAAIQSTQQKINKATLELSIMPDGDRGKEAAIKANIDKWTAEVSKYTTLKANVEADTETASTALEETKEKVDDIGESVEEVAEKEIGLLGADKTETALEEVYDTLDEIDKKEIKDKEYKVTKKEEAEPAPKKPIPSKYVSKLLKPANANGTGYAPSTSQALVGELGPEIVVNRSAGTWRTVGDNGAEFAQINKGDIVFNAEQTRQLLSNGSVGSRGKALVDGKEPKTKVRGIIPYSSDDQKDVAKRAAEATKEKTEADTKATKEISEFSDSINWAENSITNLNRKIDKYETYLDTTNLSMKNQINGYKKLISAQKDLVYGLQQTAKVNKSEYTQALKASGVSKYRSRIENGSRFSIQDFKGKSDGDTQKLFENVKKAQEAYQKWQDSLVDSKEARKVLSDQATALADIRWDEATEKVEKYNDQIDVLNTRLDMSGSKKGQLGLMDKIIAKQKAMVRVQEQAVLANKKDTAKAWSQLGTTKKLQDLNGKSLQQGEYIKVSAIDRSTESGVKQYVQAVKYNKLLKEQKTNVAELATIEVDAAAEMAELAQQKFEIYETYWNNKISFTQNKADTVSAMQDKAEAQGMVASTKYTKRLQGYNERALGYAEKNAADLRAQLLKAVNTGAVEEFSNDWYAMAEAVQNADQEVMKLETTAEKLKDTLDEIAKQSFQNILDSIDAVVSEAEFLSELLSEGNMFTDSGVYTDDGLATQGLAAERYNFYYAKAEKHKAKIEEINKKIAANPADSTLIAKKQDLVEAYQDTISAANNEKKAIISLAQEGIQVEIDANTELINAKKEALSIAKETDDYNKNVAEKAKNVAKFEKQIAALENDTSQSARKKLHELKAELAKAKEDLADTTSEHAIEMQQDAYDKDIENMTKSMTEYSEDTETLFKNTIDTVNSSSTKIAKTLKETAEKVGYDIQTEVLGAWKEGSNGIQIYSKNFTTAATSIGGIIDGITDKWTAYQKAADKAAKAGLDALTADNSDLTSGVNPSSSLKNIIGTGGNVSNLLKSTNAESEINDYLRSLGYAPISNEKKFQLASSLGMNSVTSAKDFAGSREERKADEDYLIHLLKEQLGSSEKSLKSKMIKNIVGEQSKSEGANNKGGSILNKWLATKNYGAVSGDKMLQLAKIFDLDGINSSEDAKIAKNSAKIKKAMSDFLGGKSSFSTGGVAVDIQKTINSFGDDGIATIKKGETMLTDEFTRLMPLSVDLMKQLENSNVQKSLSALTTYSVPTTTTDSTPNINIEVTSPLINVENMDEDMLYKIKNDKQIQKTIQDITIGQMTTGAYKAGARW